MLRNFLQRRQKHDHGKSHTLPYAGNDDGVHGDFFVGKPSHRIEAKAADQVIEQPLLVVDQRPNQGYDDHRRDDRNKIGHLEKALEPG
ncbi:hypothetical protein D1872_231990 [compost metagenome]